MWTLCEWGRNGKEAMLEYISECCYASPVLEMDMSTVKYGGPTGFCSRCFDTCGFFVPCYNCGDGATVVKDDGEIYCTDCSTWIDSMGAIGVIRGDSDGKHKD